MVKIFLPHGKFATVDDCDSHLVNWSWYRSVDGYVVRSDYVKETGKKKTIKLHHAILGQSINGLVVDHIDGNPANNERQNLRFVTQRINCQNRKEHRGEKKKSSRYLGVSLNIRKYKSSRYLGWTEQVFVNGKKKYIGIFKTEEEAARAYQDAALANGESR